MRKKRFFQYYVEGEGEKRLLNTLKTELGCIEAGRVDTFNVVQNLLPIARLRTLKPGTVVVLVFDTDKDKTDVLDENIRLLQKQTAVSAIYCIPQVRNLEDELVHSCDIKSALEITHSKSTKEFKNEFNSCTNLAARLQKCGFSVTKLWTRNANGCFQKYRNDADKIKK